MLAEIDNYCIPSPWLWPTSEFKRGQAHVVSESCLYADAGALKIHGTIPAQLPPRQKPLKS